jgi:acyl dehydratase
MSILILKSEFRAFFQRELGRSMTDADFGKITDAKVALLRGRIGAGLAPSHWTRRDPSTPKPPPTPHQEPHNTQVTVDSLRHYAAGLGDDNPLYFDLDYGSGTRWGGPIAHPLFVWTVGEEDAPPDAEPSAEYQALRKGDPIRGTGALQADLQYEFYRPLCLGDRIYKRSTSIGVKERRSAWGGRSIDAWTGVATRNHKDEITHLQRGMWIRAERRPVVEVTEPQPAPEPYTPEQLAKIDACYARAERRGAVPRYWEDVEIGDELPAKVKGPLRVTDLIVWHIGWGMNFPTYAFDFAYRKRRETPALYTTSPLNYPDVVQRMHWEEEWAVKVGASARYDFGGLREAFLMHLITDWMGDDAWLWKLSVQHRKFNFIGDTTWLKGRVSAKRQAEGRNEIMLDVWCENQRGMVTSPGTAVVLLPTRTGNAVELPQPARDDTASLLAYEIEQMDLRD